MSRDGFQKEVRSWLKSMNSNAKNKQYGEPESWEFDYPWEIVQTAFWLWSMSGFQRLPTQDEVMSFDPRYISDIRLAHTIYAHQGNDSFEMRLLEQWEAFNGDPDGYEARQKLSGISQLAQNQGDAAPMNVLQGRSMGKPVGQGNFIKRGGSNVTRKR